MWITDRGDATFAALLSNKFGSFLKMAERRTFYSIIVALSVAVLSLAAMWPVSLAAAARGGAGSFHKRGKPTIKPGHQAPG